MIAALATLLVLSAGLLMIVSGGFSEEAGARVRRAARNLILIALAAPFAAALLRSIPRSAAVIALALVSITAFAILELRYRHAAEARPFVSYRTSGKVPVHEMTPGGREETTRDGGLGAERPDEFP